MSALKPLGSTAKLKVDSVPKGVLIVSSPPEVYIVVGVEGIGLQFTVPAVRLPVVC